MITTLPVDETLFYSELLFVEENVIAALSQLPNHVLPDRKFPVIEASALSGASFAMLNEDHLMQRELDELIRAHDLRLRKEVECTSLEALVEMVKDPALHYYSIKETVPKREIVVMYRKEQCFSKAVQDLKKLMHEVLG